MSISRDNDTKHISLTLDIPECVSCNSLIRELWNSLIGELWNLFMRELWALGETMIGNLRVNSHFYKHIVVLGLHVHLREANHENLNRIWFNITRGDRKGLI